MYDFFIPGRGPLRSKQRYHFTVPNEETMLQCLNDTKDKNHGNYIVMHKGKVVARPRSEDEVNNSLSYSDFIDETFGQ